MEVASSNLVARSIEPVNLKWDLPVFFYPNTPKAAEEYSSAAFSVLSLTGPGVCIPENQIVYVLIHFTPPTHIQSVYAWKAKRIPVISAGYSVTQFLTDEDYLAVVHKGRFAHMDEHDIAAPLGNGTVVALHFRRLCLCVIKKQ